MTALSGCASIETYEDLVQPLSQPLETYVGGVVFKIKRSSDLPNAFGAADIFGGKVDGGSAQLWYQGRDENGHLRFRLTDIQTESNETTMTRYGKDRRDGQTVALPANATDFVLDMGKRQDLTVAGVHVTILSADEQALKYVLTRGASEAPAQAQQGQCPPGQSKKYGECYPEKPSF